MSLSALPLLEKVRCPFPNKSPFSTWLSSVSQPCVAAAVCAVHRDSVRSCFRLHAAFFSDQNQFLFQSSGKILPIRHILQIKLCSPPETLPSHPHINVKSANVNGVKCENRLLFIITGLVCSFLISLFHEPFKGILVYWVCLSLLFCIRFTESYKQSEHGMLIHDLETHEYLQGWTLTLNETWGWCF